MYQMVFLKSNRGLKAKRIEIVSNERARNLLQQGYSSEGATVSFEGDTYQVIESIASGDFFLRDDLPMFKFVYKVLEERFLRYIPKYLDKPQSRAPLGWYFIEHSFKSVLPSQDSGPEK